MRRLRRCEQAAILEPQREAVNPMPRGTVGHSDCTGATSLGGDASRHDSPIPWRMRTDDAEVEALLRQVIAEVNAGRPQAARALCERALSEQPGGAGSAAIHQMMAVLCMQAGDAAQARHHITISVAERPDHPPSLKIAGDVARAVGDLAAACAHYERALDLQPGRADIALALAQTLQAGGGNAAACERAWLRVVTLQPTLEEGWLQLANARQDRHDLAGAIDALRRLLSMAPTHAMAEVNLGIVLQDSGQMDAAMRAYGRAYRLRADSFGRIAHALATPPVGRLWLDLDALRAELQAAVA
jgi:tetratricopeptide (TPR) repeat protein